MRLSSRLRFGACAWQGQDGYQASFHLWAPAKDEAWVEIDGQGRIPMQAHDGGWYEAHAACGPGTRYRFAFADGLTAPDPAARAQADGDVHGWSLLVAPDDYEWAETDWKGRPWEEVVLYELHPGLCGGFKGIADRLEGLKALGVTAVELMPIAEVSGARNWGYDGVLPYAPAAAYGTPEDLKRLVEHAHRLGLMVFLDVVYNHFGPDGNYIGAYAPQFFRDDASTPWGGAIAFQRDEVRDYFIDNALYWLNEYQFDGLRFDAVHAYADPDFLARMGEAVREAFHHRHVHLVLENEANQAEPLRGPYDAQWNDDFHNVMHVLLTGETGAYYQDFADHPAQRLARCLAEGFIYQGDPSPNHDGEPRGQPSADLPPTRFVSFLQNHDQVGNRAMGERLSVLVAPERLRAATALLLLCPQIPMLFMGEEVGAETPFLFFTDFHDELADAVREGRRKEFAKFPEFSDPEKRRRIPDPNALSTYEASRVRDNASGDAWRAFYSDLLAQRRALVTPGLEGAKALGAEVIGDKAVAARWSLGDGRTLTLALNLGDAPASFQAPSGEPIRLVGLDAWAATGLPPAAFAAWIS